MVYKADHPSGRCVMSGCPKRPTDVAGARCVSCDPVVAATIYGLPRDGFRRVTERVVVEGVVARVDRIVVMWGAAPRVEAKVALGGGPNVVKAGART